MNKFRFMVVLPILLSLLLGNQVKAANENVNIEEFKVFEEDDEIKFKVVLKGKVNMKQPGKFEVIWVKFKTQMVGEGYVVSNTYSCLEGKTETISGSFDSKKVNPVFSLLTWGSALKEAFGKKVDTSSWYCIIVLDGKIERKLANVSSGRTVTKVNKGEISGSNEISGWLNKGEEHHFTLIVKRPTDKVIRMRLPSGPNAGKMSIVGEWVVVTLKRLNLTLDPYLVFIDPEGNCLAEDDDGYPEISSATKLEKEMESKNAQLSGGISRSGRFRLIVRDKTRRGSGEYHLGVYSHASYIEGTPISQNFDFLYEGPN